MPIDLTYYELWLAQCTTKAPTQPTHWIILMVHPGNDHCIWYHSVNGSGHGGYEMLIEPNKRFDSWSFEHKFFLGIFPTALGAVVSREACKVPPQNCQFWVAYVVMRLGRVGLVSGDLYGWLVGEVRERWGDEGPGDLRY